LFNHFSQYDGSKNGASCLRDFHQRFTKGSDTSSFSKAIGDYTFFLMDGQCLTTDKIMTTVHGLSMVNRAFGQ